MERVQSVDAHQGMSSRTAKRLAVALVGASFAMVGAGLALGAVSAQSGIALGFTAVTVSYGLSGGILATRRPSNPIGWLMAGVGFAESTAGLRRRLRGVRDQPLAGGTLRRDRCLDGELDLDAGTRGRLHVPPAPVSGRTSAEPPMAMGGVGRSDRAGHRDHRVRDRPVGGPVGDSGGPTEQRPDTDGCRWKPRSDRALSAVRRCGSGFRRVGVHSMATVYRRRTTAAALVLPRRSRHRGLASSPRNSRVRASSYCSSGYSCSR